MILCTEDGYEPKTEVKQLPVAIMKTYTCCIYPHPDPIRIQGFDDQKLKKKNLQLKNVRNFFG
jgi:hypothetical protein